MVMDLATAHTNLKTTPTTCCLYEPPSRPLASSNILVYYFVSKLRWPNRSAFIGYLSVSLCFVRATSRRLPPRVRLSLHQQVCTPPQRVAGAPLHQSSIGGSNDSTANRLGLCLPNTTDTHRLRVGCILSTPWLLGLRYRARSLQGQRCSS